MHQDTFLESLSHLLIIVTLEKSKSTCMRICLRSWDGRLDIDMSLHPRRDCLLLKMKERKKPLLIYTKIREDTHESSKVKPKPCYNALRVYTVSVDTKLRRILNSCNIRFNVKHKSEPRHSLSSVYVVMISMLNAQKPLSEIEIAFSLKISRS